jgi:hypothetical protein
MVNYATNLGKKLGFFLKEELIYLMVVNNSSKQLLQSLLIQK